MSCSSERTSHFPGSVQTQVTGLNDNGVTVGFWSGMNTANQANDNSGFYATGGQGFRSVSFPATDNANPPVNQLLGVNDHDVAVGFYTDSKGNTDGFTATPALPSVAHLHLQAMPAGTVTFVWAPNGQLTLQVNAFGFTPGSSHVVELQSPQGWATVAYDPNARPLTVTLTASGLTPAAHAAHIHIGSCMSQGPVQYMLMDFTANSQGQIMHQVRTVTGVTTAVPASGWYLNLHQGNSNNILANGQPTLNFRSLLCADL